MGVGSMVADTASSILTSAPLESQTSTGVDTAALLQVLVRSLRELVPAHDAEPVGLFSPLVVLSTPATVDRDREVGQR
jgi:hypothetical protein